MTSGQALPAAALAALARTESDVGRARETLARLGPALSRMMGDVAQAIEGTATGADRAMVECLHRARVDLRQSEEALGLAAGVLQATSRTALGP